MKIDLTAKQLVDRLKAKGLTLATAESCTGGGIGHAVTSVPGSSSVYPGGVISYSNDVKNAVLGVPLEVLASVGAVSEETACAMAEGVKALLKSDLAVSVTGIAGPDADGTAKPVGLVFIAVTGNKGTVVYRNMFSGDRDKIRAQTVNSAMLFLLEYIGA